MKSKRNYSLRPGFHSRRKHKQHIRHVNAPAYVACAYACIASENQVLSIITSYALGKQNHDNGEKN